MSGQPLPPETLELVLAVHAGILELDAIQSAARREQVRALHTQLLQTASGEEESGDHLPAWLLVEWPRIGESLGDLERASIESHLESCEECRQELEILQRIRRSSAAQPASSGVRAARRRLPLLAVWATLATAAALLLWLRPPLGVQGGGEIATIQLPATLRGEATAPIFELPEDCRELRLELTQLYPSPLRREMLEAGLEGMLFFVRAPGDAVESLAAALDAPEFSRSPSFVLTAKPGETLQVGRYECSAWRRLAENASVDQRFVFELRNAGDVSEAP